MGEMIGPAIKDDLRIGEGAIMLVGVVLGKGAIAGVRVQPGSFVPWLSAEARPQLAGAQECR
jgi:hypothetical protein